jgi:hypothetical protein
MGHNDAPCGRPTPGRPIGRPGVGHPQGIFGVFSYYQLAMLFFNMVCLIMALAWSESLRFSSTVFDSLIVPFCFSSAAFQFWGWTQGHGDDD